MASWQTFIHRVAVSVRGSRASLAWPLPTVEQFAFADHLPLTRATPSPPATRITPATQPDLTPTHDTFCVVCLMAWEEQGDWHGVRPAGEPDFCEHHFARILAAFPHPDECQIVLFRLSLHGRA